MEELTQQYLKEILDYDENTGDFVWKKRDPEVKKNLAFNGQFAGKVAGCIATDVKGWKYRVIKISKKCYKAHRLAFLYKVGRFPEITDHINRDTLDNRWENLREATYTVNNRNKSIAKNNTSGYTGVTWDKKCGKWRAYLHTKDKTSTHIGMFSTKEEAHQKLVEIREQFGYTEDHGM